MFTVYWTEGNVAVTNPFTTKEEAQKWCDNFNRYVNATYEVREVKGQDYTIQLWSIQGHPIAECNCPEGWRAVRAHGPAIERAIATHRKMHADNGDSTEVV